MTTDQHPQGSESTPMSGSTIRPVADASSQHMNQASPEPRLSRSRPSSKTFEPDNGQQAYVDKSQSGHSIPRKQPGPTSAVPSYPPTHSSLPMPRKTDRPPQNASDASRLPTSSTGDGDRQLTSSLSPQASFVPSQVKEGSLDSADPRIVQATVERAKTNSVQTHVSESVAPGKPTSRCPINPLQ